MSISFCKIYDWSVVDNNQNVSIDLTELVVCPFYIAYELLQQLGSIEREQYIQDVFNQLVFNDLNNATNIWYGLESLGNTNIIKAKKLAAKINQKVKINLLVDRYITEENLAFIWYVNQYSQSEITFYYQQEIFENYYSPIFQKLDYNKLEDFDGRKIPYFGEETIKDIKYIYEAIIKSSYFSFLNYRNHEFSYKFILDFIGNILRTGATDLAVYLFKTLTQCEKNTSNQAKLFIICLGQQLGLQKYPEIVEEAVPEFMNSNAYLPSLYFIKGYANLLLNNVETSANFFALAGIDENLTVKDYQDLYKLNILALLKFKQGQPQEALAIQKRIKDYQDHPEFYQTNIYYTNELNLGRLARYFREYDRTLEHFQSAFKQLEGIKQPADYIYYCLLVAQLFECQQSWKQTLFYWTLAALIWSALPCKNAMNWRVLLSLLTENYTIEKPVTSEMISEAFINKLQWLMKLLSIKTVATVQNITIRVLDSDQSPVEGAYVHSDFLSFIASHQPSPVVDLFENSQSFQKLNNLLVAIIRTQIKHLDLGKYQTLYLDLDNGVDIPQSLDHILVRGWQLNLQVICLNKTLNFDEYSPKIEDKITVNIHPAVRDFQEVNGIYSAWFKRYFSPYQLSEYQQPIIKRLLDGSYPPNPSYRSLKQQFPHFSNQLLFSMQAEHLIYLKSAG
ncbi:MAG: hypothetical protein EA365_00295 [Gloeocapsa sp. DLM2.Bin57]|nr:MAG: hypothetical protein EA365_00295 [Gloeocapsa sp. DLM2.Bin57]